MENIVLFIDKTGREISTVDFYNTLKRLKADECDVLYIHSSLNFGVPNLKLKKKQLLQALLDVIKALNVRTICMPTFTFSFCNGLDYNPVTSASKMGILNEYFRKQEDVVRSNDPLMSVALWGENKSLLDVGHVSCGENSTFDKIRHTPNVKFLFLGPKIGDCLTYMHYLEWLYSVDYRYQRKFIGDVTINGITKREEYELFVRYNGVIPNTASYEYEQRMYDKGVALIERIGDGTISIVDKDVATEEYFLCLKENPHFFVDMKDGALVQDKTFVLNSEMVAM